MPASSDGSEACQPASRLQPPRPLPPRRRSFTYEEFNACQQRHQKKAAEALAVRNEEVARSIDDVVVLVRAYPRENPQCQLDEREVDLFRAYYSGIMYKASRRGGGSWVGGV